MIKNKNRSSYKNKSRNKKSSEIGNSYNFMKKSNISPRFQVTDLNESNLLKSPAPVAPQVINSIENPYTISNNSAPIVNQDQNSSINYDNTDNNTDDEYYENSDIYDEYNSDDDINMDNVNDSYATSIRNKDMRIFKMKVILEEKKKQMFEKEKEVRELHQNNSFLQAVINDYENYNNVILEEKNKQKIAIKILSDHIRDISRDIKNDHYKLGHAKKDQNMLLEELKNIQDEIKEALSMKGNRNDYISSDEQTYNSFSDY